MITSNSRNFSNSTIAGTPATEVKSTIAGTLGTLEILVGRVGKSATVETLAIAGTNKQQG
jgi:hypothetical protein